LQTLPEFNLLLISSWIRFWFVIVVPKYLNCATFSKHLLPTFMFIRLPKSKMWIFWNPVVVRHTDFIVVRHSASNNFLFEQHIIVKVNHMQYICTDFIFAVFSNVQFNAAEICESLLHDII
jgi:hypothetical protein